MSRVGEPQAPPDGRSLGRWFDWPRGPLLSLALILLVCLPGLPTDYIADDLIHRELLAGSAPPRTADMAYCFSGGPKQVPPLRLEPWWRNPELRLCYFRPLSSLSLALDHRLFPQQPLIAHLHSLLWFLVACAGVYGLARTLFDDRTATVASFIYGTSTAAFTARLWIAARHASVAAAFTAVGLAIYISGRERGRLGQAACGLIGLSLGLLGGEGALGGAGLVVAYELVRSPASWRARLALCAGVTALALAFVLWYARAGFGSVGCGAYADPMRDPAAFLAVLPARLLTLLSQAVFGTPSGPWMMPPLRPILPLSGALALTLLAATGWLRRESLGPEVLGKLRFLVLGAALAAVPASTALLGGRVLLIPGIALSLILAVLTRPWDGSVYRRPARSAGLRPRLAHWAGLILIAGFAVLHPIIDVGQLYYLYLTQRAERRLAASPLSHCAAAERFFVLGSNEITVGWYAPYLLKATIGQRRWDQLSLATGDLEVSRPDPRRLCLRGRTGLALGGMLYREFGPQRAVDRGQRALPLGDAVVQLGDANQSGVQSLCLELAGPATASLADPRYCWLRYDGTQLVPFELPAVHTQLVLPYVKGKLTDF